MTKGHYEACLDENREVAGLMACNPVLFNVCSRISHIYPILPSYFPQYLSIFKKILYINDLFKSIYCLAGLYSGNKKAILDKPDGFKLVFNAFIRSRAA